MSFLEELTEVAKKTLPRRYVDFEIVGGISILAKQEDGLYSLYLPYQCSYRRDGLYTFDLDKGLQCVCTNIETFQWNKVGTGKEMLLVKVKKGRNKGFWMPIFPFDFSLILDEDLAVARFEDTPKIYFDVESNAYIRKDLDNFTYEVYFVCIDGKNYWIRSRGVIFDSKSIGKARIEIKEFKTIESIPVVDEFLVKDEKGQYFCDVANCYTTFGPGAVIEVIPTEAYPLLIKHTGYYLKDEKENILGIYIASNCLNHHYSYRIYFDKPVKVAKFLKRGIITADKPFPELASDIWGVTYCDGKKEFIHQMIGDYKFQYSIEKNSDIDF